MKYTKKNTSKRPIIIIAIVIVTLVLFTLPAILWPDTTFARTISWPALFIEWLLHYVSFGIGAVLSVGIFIFVANPGNELKTWGAMVLLCFAFIGLSVLLGWVLLRVGFVVPFTGETFVPIYG